MCAVLIVNVSHVVLLLILLIKLTVSVNPPLLRLFGKLPSIALFRTRPFGVPPLSSSESRLIRYNNRYIVVVIRVETADLILVDTQKVNEWEIKEWEITKNQKEIFGRTTSKIGIRKWRSNSEREKKLWKQTMVCNHSLLMAETN